MACMDWQELYSFASKQALLGLGFEGIERLGEEYPEELKRNPIGRELLTTWMGKASAFPGVVPYQQGDVGPDAGCCLWCLLSDGAACRMDYPEVGLQEGSDNRTGSLRYRCSDVHTGKQDQQFLLLRSVAVCDRMRTDLSGNECESLYYGTGTS